MRIAQLIWSLGLGGAERCVVSLAPALKRAGHTPLVFCFHERGFLASELEASGIRAQLIPKRGRFDPTFVWRLASALRSARADILHTHLFGANLWGTLAAKIAGIPVVITEHSLRTFSPGHRTQLLLTRRLARVADAVQVVSTRLYDNLMPLCPRRLRYIPFGLDLQRIESTPALAEPPWPATAAPVGIFCRMTPEKDLESFVRAISLARTRRPEVVGVMVGDGPERPRVERLIAELGARDHFHLMGTRSDAIAILKRMRVAVLSSRWEAMPLAVLEALAVGVPLAATACEGTSALVSDGVEARLAPIGDAEALAARIVAQLEHPLPSEPGIRKVRELYALEPVRTREIIELYHEVSGNIGLQEETRVHDSLKAADPAATAERQTQ